MKYRLPIIIAIFIAFAFTTANPIQAQLFSGSDISNYSCPALQRITARLRNSTLVAPLGDDEVHRPVNNSGKFLCFYDDGGEIISRNAIPTPPSLRILQVWFVRIIAVVWALSGGAFTGLVIWIGFKYMTSFGNEYQLGQVIEDFRKWIIGLSLVFLSYPFLVTFFRLLPLSNSNCYADINLPGFQFFFPQACTVSVDDRCRDEIFKAFGELVSATARKELRDCVAAGGP